MEFSLINAFIFYFSILWRLKIPLSKFILVLWQAPELPEETLRQTGICSQGVGTFITPFFKAISKLKKYIVLCVKKPSKLGKLIVAVEEPELKKKLSRLVDTRAIQTPNDNNRKFGLLTRRVVLIKKDSNQ